MPVRVRLNSDQTTDRLRRSIGDAVRQRPPKDRPSAFLAERLRHDLLHGAEPRCSVCRLQQDGGAMPHRERPSPHDLGQSRSAMNRPSVPTEPREDEASENLKRFGSWTPSRASRHP